MTTPDAAGARDWRARLTGWPGSVLAFSWGLAEGTLFFVVPDVLLTLTALFGFRAAVKQTLLAVVGALVAGLLLFVWAANAPAAARAVQAVPFVRPAMVEKVRADFTEAGAFALLRGPLSGIPYKLYAVEAPTFTSLPVFLLASVPARLERLATGLLLFGGVGWLLRRRIAAAPRLAVAGHAIYWLVIYGYYWSTP